MHPNPASPLQVGSPLVSFPLWIIAIGRNERNHPKPLFAGSRVACASSSTAPPPLPAPWSSRSLLAPTSKMSASIIFTPPAQLPSRSPASSIASDRFLFLPAHPCARRSKKAAPTTYPYFSPIFRRFSLPV